MNTLSFVAVLLVLTIFGTHARAATTPANANASSVPPPTAFQVVERGANYKIWQREFFEMAPDGRIIPHVQKYTELATGMHYQDANGQWAESKETVGVLPDGRGAATQGAQQVYFPPDIYNGAIQIVTADGRQLQARPLGISYDDGTGTVMIAELTNSIGQILPSGNQVIYTNAFTDFAADLICTYRKSGFECDLVFREQPPTPNAFGLHPGKTKLELLTEFIDTSDPSVVDQTVDVTDGLTDQTLSYGKLQLVPGKVFQVGTDSSATDPASDVRVYKQWVNLGGRRILIEEVPYHSVKSQLKILPSPATTTAALQVGSRHLVSNKRLLPPSHPVLASVGSIIQLAALDLNKKPGVVMDYTAVGSDMTNFTFQGDTLYVVSGGVYLFGTTTIEGSTVVKYTATNSASLNILGTVNCLTSPYRPAVFTAVDDYTVGNVGWESGASLLSGTYASYALNCYNSGVPVNLHNLRISYAQCGVRVDSSTGSVIRDCQFFNDTIPLYVNNATLSVQNSLMQNVPAQSQCIYANNATVAAQQLTVHNADTLWTNASASTLALTNSLLIAVTNLGSAFTGSHNATNSSDTGVFQVAVGGAHYLPTNSPYRDQGTTNIDSTLLADIRQKTTYPPIVYSNTVFSTATTFSPQALRDTNSSPDLGYHYDPLDYAFGGCEAATNLTFSAGTAVGWFRTTAGWYHAGYGIFIDNLQTVAFQGTATAWCYWTRLNAVQEQDLTARCGPGGLDGEDNQYSQDITQSPIVQANFLRSTLVAAENGNCLRDDYGYLIVNANNSEFYIGSVGGYGLSMSLTNCLFERSGVGNSEAWLGDFAYVQNCTFHGGSVSFTGSSTTNMLINVFSCALDGTSVTIGGYANNPSCVSYDYNAYTNSSTPFGMGGAHDVIMTNGFNWQTSWLGGYYLPSDSWLINSGNTTADLLGLYYFTTQTNQVEETNSVVDIGYHYVATDQYGNPFDTDSNGIPDYIQDPSGSGSDLFWAVGNGAWNIGTTANWRNGRGVSSLKYSDGVPVHFDDSASGTSPIYVTNTVTVSPVRVTVSLTNKNYTIFGNAIAGNAVLNKNGNGTLTIVNTNTYTGGTVINGGILQLGDGSSRSGVVAGSITNNATLVFANPVTQTFGTPITGSGNVTKNIASTLLLTGTNNYSGNTVVNAGALLVTNGGTINASTGTLNIGATNGVSGTATLATGGSITVQSLLATNVVTTGTTTNLSIFNFNGGTLTTANNSGSGYAARILLASNTSWTVNGNWNLNGGTNLISNVATNNSPTNRVYVGNGVNNVQVNVNSGGVWFHAFPAVGTATNIMGLVIGSGNATNNVFTVNGGTVIITNRPGAITPITVGNSAGSTGNQLIIANGAQVLTSCRQEYGLVSGQIGNSGNNNGVLMGGTNSAGQNTIWNLGKDRLAIGNSGTSNSWVWVDAGGVITNCQVYEFNNSSSLTITNGGQLYANAVTVGRSGLNNSLVVAGADSLGNLATLAIYGVGNLTVGGGSVSSANPGTNSLVRVDAGGLVTNVASVLVGGASVTWDSNCVANVLVITNGGQVFSTGTNVIGLLNGCNGNGLSVGGGTGVSSWNLNNQTLTVGNNAKATNNTATLFAGGVLTNITSVILGGVNSTLYFNGGTLAAVTNGCLINTNSSTINAASYVQAGGAIINDNGYGINIALSLTGDTNSVGGGLTKLGNGTLTLVNTNTYTGATVVGAGTLTISGLGRLGGGNYTGNITNNGVMNLSGSGSQTFGGVISGTGSLTDSGSGTLTLSNINSYTGATTISAGELVGVTGGSCSNSSVTVSGGATNGVQITSTGGQWTCSALTDNGGSCLDFNFGSVTPSSTTAPLKVLNTYSFANPTIIIRTASGMTNGQYPLISYGGLSGNVISNVVFIPALPSNLEYFIITNAVLSTINLMIVPTNNNGALSWAVGNGSWDINVSPNWQFGGVGGFYYQEGSKLIFDDSASGTSPIHVTNVVNVTPASMTFNLTNKDYVFFSQSHAIYGLTNKLVKNGSGTLTLATLCGYHGGTLINGGTLQVGDGGTNDGWIVGNITNNSVLKFANPDYEYLNNVFIYGTGSLVFAANGAVELPSTNTYSGPTLINAGELIGTTGGSCSNSMVTVSAGATNGVHINSSGGQWICGGLTNNSGSYLDFNFGGNTPSTTIAALRVLNTFAFANPTIIIRTASGVTNGQYPLISYGSLSGTTISNVVFIPALSTNLQYSLITNAIRSTLDLAIVPINNGTLNWAVGNGNWDINLSSNWKIGGGNGGFYYQDGTNVIFDDTSSGASPIYVTNVVTVSPANVTANLTNKNYTILGNAIAGGTGLIKNGNGTITLANTNTYTGSTVINAGTLAISGTGLLGNGNYTGNITNNGTFNYAGTGSQILSGVISGNGTVTNSGAGTLVLSNNNYYTGATVISAGELVGVTGGSCSNSALTVSAAATNGVQIVATGGQWLCGGLTNNAGSYLDFNFGSVTPSTTTAPLQVLGNVALTNVNLIVRNAGGTLGVGLYPLLQYTGSLTGSMTNAAFSLPPLASGATGIIINDTTGKSIDLLVTTDASLKWAVGNGNWDINTTANWKDSAGFLVNYLNNSIVILDDSASGSSPIYVNNAVTISPASVTVNLTNKIYTILGNAIAGNAALTINGSGMLTLVNTNTYTGGTFINGGTLQLGDGSSKIGVVAGSITNNGMMVFANPFDQIFAASISGSGNVTKNVASTLILTGTNNYSGNTVINSGVLLVTNGGAISSLSGAFNVGATAGSGGTATLASGSSISVQSLLVTNVACGMSTNSIFNFNGGTLTTSNGLSTGYAANILLASNASWNVNGNWNLNGGTNLISNVATNSNPTAYVYIGSTNNNVQLTVNPNAVWWSAVPNNSSATNILSLVIGNGNATNNVLMVNGGTVIATNYNGGADPIVVGNSVNSTGNKMIITNGGQVFTRCFGIGSPISGNIGNYGNNNGLMVAGTNAAGQKSTWDFGGDRLYIGQYANNNNWVRVDRGGVITNVNLYTWGNGSSLFLTNGGQLFASGVTIGRSALNSSVIVAGADASGNPATLALIGNGSMVVGGGGWLTANPGTNNLVQVDAGGLINNVGAITVGLDTNSVGNALVITNGGQIFSSGAGVVGKQPGCNANSVTIGGGTGVSQWLLNCQPLTIGNDPAAINNSVSLFAGGVLTNVSTVILGGVNSTLDFNGGTLAAGANGYLINTNSATVNATNFVQVGGVVIDTVGFIVSNTLPLLQDPSSTGGGLTKLGTGTLTLLGANTYSGPTVVNAGTLTLGGNLSIASSPTILVASGAVFDASGLSSPFAMGNSQTLSNINSGAYLSGAIDVSSAAISLNYDGANAAFIVTNGNLTLSSNTVFNLNIAGSTLPAGSYEIIAPAMSGNTGWVNGTVPASVTYTGASLSGTPTLQIILGGLYLSVGGNSSAIGYANTLFTNNGTAQSPTITFAGSTGAKTTNYVGISVDYGPSINPPTNAGVYYVSNTVASDATYFGAANGIAFTILPCAVVTVSFPTTNGVAINPAFCGLSYEKVMLTGHLFNSTNTSLINMFSQIAPAVMRIGANSVDTTCWGGLSNLTAITPAQVDAFAGFINALPTNWQVIYGINLSVNNPTNCVAEAAYVANALGSHLLGFEIGNEPDVYYSNGLRPSNYVYTNYLAEWRVMAAAITNGVSGWAMTNGGKGWALTGPVSASNTKGYTMPFATNETGVISLLSQHYFRGNGQSTNSTMALLLSTDTNLLATISNIVIAATAENLPLGFRVGECGSFYNGGNAVSSQFGAALWTLDFIFTVALNGGQGVNFHSGGQSFNSYTPIADNGNTVVMARPEFYGLKLFSLAGQGSVLPASIWLDTNINFSAYGMQQAAGVMGAVLVNKDTNNYAQVTINLGANVAAVSSMMLSGTALYSTNGYTLGGAPINADGSWTGGFQSVIRATGGQVTVTVPPISAMWLRPIVGETNVLSIITQPQTQTVAQGSNVTFGVTATGLTPLSYQWYFNGNALIGRTSSTLTLTNVQATNAGVYFVTVSNVAGTIRSAYAMLRIPSPVVAWGVSWNNRTAVPDDLTNAVAVAGGYDNTLALRNDGTVVAWGGQTNVSAGLTSVAAIATGGGQHGNLSLALRSNGTVVAWGDNYYDVYDQTNVPDGVTNVVAIAAGNYHGLALKGDGTVVAWGNNWSFQTNVPDAAMNVVAIAAGGWHNLALKTDGTVVAWGAQTNVPDGLTNVVAIAAGGGEMGDYSLALKNDGTVVAWGAQTTVPDGLNNVVAISAGGEHSMALKENGTVVAWGVNGYGQTIVPVGLTNVMGIAAGWYHSLALGYSLPIIIGQPQSQSVAQGSNVTFSVTVAESGLSYQWQKNGGAISGANSRNYTITGVTTNDAADYTLVLSNMVGSVTSTPPATLAVYVPVSITEQPQSQTVVQGSNVTFNVTATGAISYYQWLKNGSDIGCNNSSYTITNVGVNDAGDYTVVVWNDYESVTSSAARLMVIVPVSITKQPQSQGTSLGRSVSFNVTATGTTPDYQWYFNVTNLLSGETNSSLVIANIQEINAGNYSVCVTNLYSSLTSSNAGLIVSTSEPPSVITQPLSQTVIQGSNVTFSVTASGTEPLVYQWYFNAGVLTGQTNASLALTNVKAANVGIYYVVVSNSAYASVQSAYAMLRMPSPVVAWGNNGNNQTMVPVDLTNAVAVAGGNRHSLALRSDGTVVAWGANDYGQTNVPTGLTNVVAITAGDYHSLALKSDETVVAWGYDYYNQTNVPDGLTNVTAIAAGKYQSLALKNDGTVVAWGSQMTMPDGLTNVVAIAAGGYQDLALKGDGTVVAWGDLTTMPDGLTNVVAVAAVGGDYGDCCLALRNDGTMVAWGIDYDLTNMPSGLTNVVAIGAGGEHSMALKSDGSVVSWGYDEYGQRDVPAGLTNVTAIAGGVYHSLAIGYLFPTITSQPACLSIEQQASNATFNVVAIGSQPLSYQWQKNGVDIGGATGSSYNITGVTTNDAGSYTVVVSNVVGSVTSGVELLLVRVLPFIAVQPQSQGVNLGETVTFSVSAGGTTPLSYQWYFNGITLLIGATNSSLILTNVQAVASGSYLVNIANSGGNVTSSNAVLTVIDQPPVSVTTNAGGNATFTVGVAGTGSQFYQWQRNGYDLNDGGNISGSATSTLMVANLTFLDSGIYSVLVTNLDGSVSSVYAALRVWTPSSVVAWGETNYGQALAPSSLTNVVAVAAGENHSLALNNDGTMVAWGDNTYGQTNIPAGLTNVVAIAGGANHCLALKNDGTVIAWGLNIYGQTNVPAGLTNVLAIAGGGNHSLALKNDGTVVAWGWSIYHQTDVPAGLTNAVAIAGGGNHSLALKTDGTVVAWGDNAYGQTNVPAGLTNVVVIAANANHSLALKKDGEIVAWGDNAYGQTNVPDGLTNAVLIAAGDNHNLALKKDGTVVAWGDNTYGQTNVPAGLTNVVTIAGGGNHSLLVGNQMPIITAQPQSQTVIQGAGVIFSVTTIGTAPLSYQWKKNGVSIDGATNPNYTLAGVTADDAATYNVIITNLAGSVTSSDAVLTVNNPLPPNITTQPQSQTVIQGAEVTFSVTAAGTAPLSYQWYFNGTNLLVGNTNSVVTLASVQPAQAGAYSVVITNVAGSVISWDANLTVNAGNRLGYWSFDDNNTWAGSAGQLPLVVSNVVGIPSWSTNAVLIDNTNAAMLAYHEIETGGNTNINVQNGTIRFWFKADWSSAIFGGNGPGTAGRLIELGSYNSVFTNGWWALYLSPDGSSISFGTSTNGAGETNLAASIAWNANEWHQLVLTYTALKSVLYLDGQVAATGSGVAYYPNATERAVGFRIGSGQNGNSQAAGVFDELETFDYSLDTASILANYQWAIALDSDGNGLSNIIENQIGLNPYDNHSPNGLSAGQPFQIFTPLK